MEHSADGAALGPFGLRFAGGAVIALTPVNTAQIYSFRVTSGLDLVAERMIADLGLSTVQRVSAMENAVRLAAVGDVDTDFASVVMADNSLLDQHRSPASRLPASAPQDVHPSRSVRENSSTRLPVHSSSMKV